MSYTFEVYYGRQKAEKHLGIYALYVMFYPQLVAGPIERAFNLLPQFHKKRLFDLNLAVKGMRQILWGLFKKIVIADTLSTYVDTIFNSYEVLPGSTLLLGAIYFSVQIYCDFSGYSSIAIGTARLFGFTLLQNFSYPYFSTNVSQFWRKWHISLTSWFRDYVYIPMGGSRGSLTKTIFNTLFVFALSGFWHGANWTFVIWGLLNGMYLIPNLILKNKKVISENNLFGIFSMLITFGLITFSWIFFRSTNVAQAFEYINGLFSKSLFTYPVQHGMAITIPLIAILFGVEWIRKKEIELFQPQNIHFILRWIIYLVMIIICLAFFKQNQSFIYFQF
jgi:D-alanyl-lipoteichoic acid acyltransferase DltB (MBOAT superfamily)